MNPREIIERFYKCCIGEDPEGKVLLDSGVVYEMTGDVEIQVNGPDAVFSYLSRRRPGHARQLLFIRSVEDGTEAEFRLVAPDAEEQIVTERAVVRQGRIAAFSARSVVD
ncbi:MAG: hypothetical protein AB1679_35545 [Actinomycetota bacterium]